MFGNKVYELSLVKDYVSHWGLAEAARELIQNALDSNSPFQYSFVQSEEDGFWSFELRSEHSRLEPHHLLLGSTSKAKDKSAIGSFGEGFKIALLVLTRIGHPVTIKNNERLWSPMFRMNKSFGTELLCVEERIQSKGDTGLTFVVERLDDTDRATIEGCCLKMQPEIGQTIATAFGDILIDRPGELYVGSLLVSKENDLKYGYNIKPEHISLERDRQTVSDWDLRSMTRDMWYDTLRYDEIAQMIYDDVPDLYYARYSSTEVVKMAVLRLFDEKHPGAIVAESPSELKKMVEKGLTNTVYIGGTTGSVLRSTGAYSDRLSSFSAKPPQTPHQFLYSWMHANLEADTLLRKHFEEQVLDAASHWTNS